MNLFFRTLLCLSLLTASFERANAGFNLPPDGLLPAAADLGLVLLYGSLLSRGFSREDISEELDDFRRETELHARIERMAQDIVDEAVGSLEHEDDRIPRRLKDRLALWLKRLFH